MNAIYNGKCDLKKTCINNSLFKSLKWKLLVYGAGAAWSRLFLPWSQSRSQPNLVGAGVGSGTSDFRSLPKKWRLRNTDSDPESDPQNLTHFWKTVKRFLSF